MPQHVFNSDLYWKHNSNPLITTNQIIDTDFVRTIFIYYKNQNQTVYEPISDQTNLVTDQLLQAQLRFWIPLGSYFCGSYAGFPAIDNGIIDKVHPEKGSIICRPWLSLSNLLPDICHKVHIAQNCSVPLLCSFPTYLQPAIYQVDNKAEVILTACTTVDSTKIDYRNMKNSLIHVHEWELGLHSFMAETQKTQAEKQIQSWDNSNSIHQCPYYRYKLLIDGGQFDINSWSESSDRFRAEAQKKGQRNGDSSATTNPTFETSDSDEASDINISVQDANIKAWLLETS